MVALQVSCSERVLAVWLRELEEAVKRIVGDAGKVAVRGSYVGALVEESDLEILFKVAAETGRQPELVLCFHTDDAEELMCDYAKKHPDLAWILGILTDYDEEKIRNVFEVCLGS